MEHASFTIKLRTHARLVNGHLCLLTESVPWRPSHRRDTSCEHPDLRTAKTLTGILNKTADGNSACIRGKLSSLTVVTEYGLYLLVDTVYRRALAEPSEISRCADVCAVLADMQASFLSLDSHVIAHR